jgi:hypothetical protein
MKTKKQPGDGKYNIPVELNSGKGDDPSAKGVDYSKVVYGSEPHNKALPKVRNGKEV